LGRARGEILGVAAEALDVLQLREVDITQLRLALSVPAQPIDSHAVDPQTDLGEPLARIAEHTATRGDIQVLAWLVL